MTMRFLMFIKHAENSHPVAPPKSLMNAMETFVGEGFKTGWLKETGGLKSTSESIRIRSKGGPLAGTGGPVPQTQENPRRYPLLETDSKDEALDVARRFMELHRIHWPEF